MMQAASFMFDAANQAIAPRTDDFTELQEGVLSDRPIGEIIRRAKGLSSAQIESALAYQRKHGVRFGDAAVALGVATSHDVMWALSQQFHYSYAPSADGKLHEELVVANRPFSDEVEPFRDLRSQLLMSGGSQPDHRRAVALLSADIGDGKTFMIANLAVAFSQLPGRTLLVDADMRSPRLHSVFGLKTGTGLSGILAGRSEPSVIQPVPHLPNLYLLRVGAVPPNPLELLLRSRFRVLLAELGRKFDHVLIDTPAASHGSDARVIAAECAKVLVVGRRDRTRVPALQKLVGQLAKGPAHLAGVVFNEF